MVAAALLGALSLGASPRSDLANLVQNSGFVRAHGHDAAHPDSLIPKATNLKADRKEDLGPEREAQLAAIHRLEKSTGVRAPAAATIDSTIDNAMQALGADAVAPDLHVYPSKPPKKCVDAAGKPTWCETAADPIKAAKAALVKEAEKEKRLAAKKVAAVKRVAYADQQAQQAAELALAEKEVQGVVDALAKAKAELGEPPEPKAPQPDNSKPKKKCVDSAGNPTWCDAKALQPKKKCVDAAGDPAWCMGAADTGTQTAQPPAQESAISQKPSADLSWYQPQPNGINKDEVIPLAAAQGPAIATLVPRLRCTSTAVDLKSAACDRHCNLNDPTACPVACLCVAVPDASDRSHRVSHAVLHKLATKLRNSTAAERPVKMHKLKEAASRAVTRLTLAPPPGVSGSAEEASSCASLADNIPDAWCVNNCRIKCPDMCVCDGSVESLSDVTARLKRSATAPSEASEAEPQQSYKFKRETTTWKWTVGYYAWTWDPTPTVHKENNGPKEANLGVQFSGEVNVTAALKAVGAITLPCDGTQRDWCDGQLQFYRNSGKSDTEAKEQILKEFAENCRSCLLTKEDLKTASAHPFSVASGLHRGSQFLSLGGGRSEAGWAVETLSGLVDGGQEIEAIKDAGFAGVCFDIEETTGGEELIEAFERSFAALKRAGLSVMVTTSHSAPYAATSDATRIGLVDSWVKSKNVDYISPQLYTVGGEGKPEFEPTSGTSGPVGYEHYQKIAKAKFVPSVVSAAQADEVKRHFAGMGIKVDGFIQWQQEKTAPSQEAPGAAEPASAPAPSAEDANCIAHGICDEASTKPKNHSQGFRALLKDFKQHEKQADKRSKWPLAAWWQHKAV